MFSKQNQDHSSNGASKFIHAVLFTNPIWDIGLQFTLAQKKVGILYIPNSKRTVPFSSKCVCPCSSLFRPWHNNNSFSILTKFHSCDSPVYKCHTNFIGHLCSVRSDYYHRILLRLVQSTYSVLLSKLKISTAVECSENIHKFGMIHKGHISLHSYVKSSSKHQVFVIALRGFSIALSRTNILHYNLYKISQILCWQQDTNPFTTISAVKTKQYGIQYFPIKLDAIIHQGS